jgi:predicted metal-binding membrane protein
VGRFRDGRLSGGRRGGRDHDAAAGARSRRSDRDRCVLIAGAFQFSAWKTRHLSCCREEPSPSRTLQADDDTAWRYGLRLGLHCSQCCAGLTAILLAIGVMDLRAMAVVGAAITIERLAPAGERVARAIGAVVVAAGLLLIARAAGLG